MWDHFITNANKYHFIVSIPPVAGAYAGFFKKGFH